MKRTGGCLLPGPLRKLLLVTVALLLVFYLALCTGLLSPLIDSLVSRAVSSRETSVNVYGIRTDLFWRTTVDSIVVTDIDGLVVKVDGSRIMGSLPGYLLTGHVRGIDVERLDILLPPLPDEESEPDSLCTILRIIDVSVVVTTGRLKVDYGRIHYPDAPLLDSIALETSIHRAPALELEVAHAAVELTGIGPISGSGHLELDDLLLSSDGFSVAAVPGSATLSGWLQGASCTGSIDLSGRVETWTDEMPLSGWADFSGHLDGSISDPLIELTLLDGGVRVLDMDASLSVDTITFDLDTLRVDGLAVESEMLSADISGSISLSGMDWSCSAWLDLTGLDLSRLAGSAPASVLFGSAILTAYGNNGSPRSGALTARLHNSRVDTVGLDSVYVRLDLSSGRAAIESFIGTPEGSASVFGHCELGAGWKPVSYAGEVVISLQGAYRLRDIIDAEGSVAGIEADMSLSGAGGSFIAVGSVYLDAFDYTGLSASALSWAGSVGIRDDRADISGDLSAGGLRISTDNGAGLPGSSGSGVSWSGTVEVSSGNARITGILTADSLELERETSYGIPGVSAAGLNWDGSLRSSGGSSDLAGTLTLAFAKLIPDEQGNVADVLLHGLAWEGSGSLRRGTSPQLNGTLNVDSICVADLGLSLETEMDLQRDTLLLPGFVLSDRRNVNIQAAVRTVLGEEFSLELERIRIGIGTKLKITSDGELAVHVSGDSIFLDTLWLEPPIGLLTASGRFGPGKEAVFRLWLNDIDLTGLMNVFSISEDLSGIGDLTVSVEAREETLSASIIGSVRGPSYGKWTQADSLTVDISITESDLKLNGFYIWYDGNRSGLQARIDDIWEDGEISIRPRSLAWFELELNNLGDGLFYALPLPVKTSGAALSARVEYTRGTTTTPAELSAFVSARIDRLFVTSLGLQFPNVTLYVLYPDTTTSQYNSRASLVSGTGDDGSFSIQFLANVVRELPDITVREYQLNANLDHWRTIVLNAGQIELSGYLQSSGDDLSERPEIEGRITIDQGLVGFSSDGASSSGNGDSELPFDLKIEVVSDRGLWFRSSMANIELSADLRILTQSRQLTASGVVQTVRGKVRLLQKDFDIMHGTIEVRQGLPPDLHLDIHARTTVRDVMSGENYDIEIVISGDPSNPEILLSGTGPAGILAQEDILSLLAVGLTYGELQQLDSSTIGSELEFVAQSYVGQLLAGHIRDGIGLDALEITPELLSDSTALTVKVGKYVLPDLYISYAGDFFSSDPGVFSAQFYISRDFSILGSMKSTLNGDQEPSIELHYTLRY